MHCIHRLLSDEDELKKPKFVIENDSGNACVERHPVMNGVEINEDEENKSPEPTQPQEEEDDTMTDEEMYKLCLLKLFY